MSLLKKGGPQVLGLTLSTVGELITCVPAERCLKGGKCVKGMHGPVCGLCDKDHVMGSKDL